VSNLSQSDSHKDFGEPIGDLFEIGIGTIFKTGVAVIAGFLACSIDVGGGYKRTVALQRSRYPKEEAKEATNNE